MKIEIARKVSRESSWVIDRYVADENLYNWLIRELVLIQNSDYRIYYRKYYALKISTLSKVYHYYLTSEGYQRAKKVLINFVKEVRDRRK